MKILKSIEMNRAWAFCILWACSFYSFAASASGEVCVSCGTPMASENSPETRKSSGMSATEIMREKHHGGTLEEQRFFSHLFMYCSIIEDHQNEKQFHKKMLAPMSEKSFGSHPDRYWTEAGCEPRYIADTWSPIPHIIAENATDRMQFLVYLKKVYVARNDLATFKKIINSKNSQGQTVLDYIQYVWSTQRYIKEEEPALNAFAKYLCDNGAEYSTYKTKKCPAEYMRIN